MALAAALPELPYACGLATASLFMLDVSTSPLLAVGGVLPVHAVTPDADALAAAAAGPDTASRWVDRLAAVRSLVPLGQDRRP